MDMDKHMSKQSNKHEFKTDFTVDLMWLGLAKGCPNNGVRKY